MLWGQRIVVYTDHKNLIQDALGLTSDRVYRWRLIIEEYGPEIIYTKGINNNVADAISRLDFSPIAHPNADKKNWMNFAKCYCAVQNSQDQSKKDFTMDMNHVFANLNRSDEEEEIYPLTVNEIA